MSISDRAFRFLAQGKPDVIVSVLQALAPEVVTEGTELSPEMVDDSRIESPPMLDADWVARLGDHQLLHVECQGYRDKTFPMRLFRYHLGLVLRYPTRYVRTIAIWLMTPPATQRPSVIEVGDVTIRVTSIVLAQQSAEMLLAHPRAACFAPGADAGPLSNVELCRKVAKVLAETKATYRERHMAAVAAKSRGRYKEMIMAMKEANLEPVIIEDLVRIGIDQGIEQGLERGMEQGLERGMEQGLERGIEQGRIEMARHMLFETLDARGLTISPDHRRRIEAESSIERLTELLRRAVRASSIDDVLV